MREIDWSKAPEGATHYGPEDRIYVECWYKKCGEAWLFAAANSDWQWSENKVSISPGRLHGIIPRPSQPWTGTGLPPVGTVCEMTHENWGNRGWEKVTIKYCSAEYAITTDGHGEQHWHIRNVTFRPIKTQAQIEAEAREAAIMDIYQTICISRAQAEAIYNAGYRKQSTCDPHDSDD